MLIAILLGAMTGCTAQHAAAPNASIATVPTTSPTAGQLLADRIDMARRTHDALLAKIQQNGEAGLAERACEWSSRWRDAELDATRDQQLQRNLERDHLERVRVIGKEILKQSHAQFVTRVDIAAVAYYAKDAELRVQRQTAPK